MVLCSESMIHIFRQTQRVTRQFPPCRTSFQLLIAMQQYPRWQSQTNVSTFVSLPSNSIGNANNDCNGYKSLPTPPSPHNGSPPDCGNQDYTDASNLSSNKRRSERQLPQRERGSSTKAVPRSERDVAISSKTSSSSQSKSAHSADDRGHRNERATNRSSMSSKYDTSKELTKTVSLMYLPPCVPQTI